MPEVTDRSKLKKDELLAEIAILDARVADLEAGAVDAPSGLLPMVLYVSGAVWNGTAIRLIRCEPKGPNADKWLIQEGDKIVMPSGHSIPALPFHQIAPTLQPKVTWDLDAARKHLKV